MYVIHIHEWSIARWMFLPFPFVPSVRIGHTVEVVEDLDSLACS